MSPIGRVFIVLNLALAGTFVGFAGTYLQHQADFKSQLAEANDKADKDKQQSDSTIAGLRKDLNQKEAANIRLNQNKESLETEVKRLNGTNKNLQTQFAKLSGDVQLMAANSTTVADKIDSAYNKADASEKMAIDAIKAKDSAEDQLSSAQKQIQDKDRMIANLTNTGENQTARIADLEKEVRDQKTLIAAVVAKDPTILGNISLAPPLAGGSVFEAVGQAVTIVAPLNAEDREKFRGASIGVWDASGYKGEVRVTDTAAKGEQMYLFGNIVLEADGKKISAGDRATN